MNKLVGRPRNKINSSLISKRICLHINTKQLIWLDNQADLLNISRSNLIRQLIDDRIHNYEREEDSA